MKAFAFRHASLLAFIVLLGLWELACRALAVPEFILPAPSAIALAAGSLGLARWAEHLWATIEVALLGYALAIALSIPLAVAITRSALLSRIVMPWLVVIQSTPIVAVAPIIVVTLGAGVLPRVAITTLRSDSSSAS